MTGPVSAPLVIEIPGLRVRSDANLRECWRARYRRRKHQRQIVGIIARAHVAAWMRRHDPAPIAVRVTLTRIAPRPIRDDDNLASGFKGIRDEVALLLGFDDGDRVRIRFRYRQSRGPVAVRIEIEDADFTDQEGNRE